MEPEHHDPAAEAMRGGLEKLMALGVLAEAGSRLAAERARARGAQEELQLARERATEQAAGQARRLAQAEASRRTLQWQRLASAPDRLAAYLAGLPVQEVARHWLQAATQTGATPEAHRVQAAAERELHGRMPSLMTAYDRVRQAGADPLAAMRTAAREVFPAGARPHGADPYAAAPAALPALADELEQQLRGSAGRLGPVARSRWLRGLEERGWSPESLAWAESLLTRAGDLRRTAAAAAGGVDDPVTAGDERVDGLDAAGLATGQADDLAADATAVRGSIGRPITVDGLAAATTAGSAAGQQVRVAMLSYPTPASAALRPAAPSPRPSPPAPRRARHKGRTP